jgi:hypothetical protein
VILKLEKCVVSLFRQTLVLPQYGNTSTDDLGVSIDLDLGLHGPRPEGLVGIIAFVTNVTVNIRSRWKLAETRFPRIRINSLDATQCNKTQRNKHCSQQSVVMMWPSRSTQYANSIFDRSTRKRTQQ